MILAEKIVSEFKKNRGVRVGQTAVVSRKVHTINPKHPQIVNIITNTDAGKVFYNRFNEGDIVHIDLFHELVMCDVKKIANYLIDNLANSSYGKLLEYIDIQTGAGGGKLTGNLEYGKSESLRKDHLNHVHIAGLIDDDNLDSIFLIVGSIEEALLEQNIELRKVEKIKHEFGDSPMDMSPYMTDTDSNLRENNPSSNNNGAYSDAVEITNYFGSIRVVEEILENIKKNDPEEMKNIKKQNSEYEDILTYCEKNDFLTKGRNRYKLTDRGEALYNVLRLYKRELERILKASIRNMPKTRQNKGLIVSPSSKSVYMCAKTGPALTSPFDKEKSFDEIDTIQTVKNALIRCHLEKSKFNITEEDLIVTNRIPKLEQDICLLIDASASMAGHRLRNAKFLAKHLLLKSQRKVSVLAFQDKVVKTYVPFTNDFNDLEDGLNKITSLGLTPLALAIDKGIEYISFKNLKNPLIMLVTDGIPTVPLESSDPIKDAIKAATKIAGKKINFCCIGLQPNKGCLVKVAEAAKGKLFIVDELNRDVLLEVAKRSEQRL